MNDTIMIHEISNNNHISIYYKYSIYKFINTNYLINKKIIFFTIKTKKTTNNPDCYITPPHYLPLYKQTPTPTGISMVNSRRR